MKVALMGPCHLRCCLLEFCSSIYPRYLKSEQDLLKSLFGCPGVFNLNGCITHLSKFYLITTVNLFDGSFFPEYFPPPLATFSHFEDPCSLYFISEFRDT